MKRTLPLTIAPLSARSTLFPLTAEEPTAPLGLARLERVARTGPLLHPGPFADMPDVLSLNLFQGCAQRCSFCSARAYPTYPGDEKVSLYEDTPERLVKELASRTRKPRAVFLSPSTDPFMPLPDVQAETCRVVEVLADQGIEAWLMTRGYIRPSALAVLAAHRERVRVTIGLTTVERGLQRILEPLAASPRLRLRQIARLRDCGVPVQVEVAPLVPGLTDTRERLAGLLEALALVGIRKITAGYMFLRPGIRDNLTRALAPHGLDEAVLREFADGVVIQAAGLAPAKYLARARRQRGYAALKAIGAGLGISVNICGLTNPDFQPPHRPATDAAPRQRWLPRV